MRLLSSLLFLLVASCSLAAPVVPNEPEAPRTSIETFVETVTRTIIHQVTDPTTTVAEAEEVTEGSGVEETEGSGVEEAVDEKEENKVEEVSSPDASDVLAPVAVASDTGDAAKPCECPTAETATETATTAEAEAAAADTTITEISGTVKVCSCEDADECRKQSVDGMDKCMEECEDDLKGYGEKTKEYLKCFEKSKPAIEEAENCLFKNKTDYCAAKDEAKFIEKTNWDDLATIQYSSTAEKTIAGNSLWKRDEKKYNMVQKFFHCTKHCMHKKLESCSATKQCAIKMPAHDDMEKKMKTCTKKNVKISNAILTTCQCLAWTHGVKSMQGSCVVIGNSYFVDRA